MCGKKIYPGTQGKYPVVLFREQQLVVFPAVLVLVFQKHIVDATAELVPWFKGAVP